MAVVTGGSRGVGRLLAEELVAANAAVTIVGRDADRLAATASALQSTGGDVRHLVADVLDPDGIASAIALTRQELGPIDILVNNAGVVNIGPVESVDPEFWWQAFEINVQGAMRWCQAVLPEMLERASGQIVNVTSTAAVWTIPGGSAYTASKAALSAFTRVLNAETSRRGVRAYAYAPRLETDMTAHIGQSPLLPKALRDSWQSMTAGEREGQRARSIDLFHRIVSGDLEKHAGEQLESETPPPPGMTS